MRLSHLAEWRVLVAEIAPTGLKGNIVGWPGSLCIFILSFFMKFRLSGVFENEILKIYITVEM
jgi:hypothetical protein